MPNRSSTTKIIFLLRLIEACIGSKSLKQGKIIHQCILKLIGEDFGSQSPHLDKLVRFYLSCNRHQLAHRVFNSIPNHSRKNKTILWNQIIRAYAWDGPFEKAVDLYNEMVDTGVIPTKYTFPFVLKACSTLQDVDSGVKIHGHAKRYNLENDVYVCTALVDFYVKCGYLVEAREVFDGMPRRDVVAWNAMAAGFSLHGLCLDAIGLVSEMQNKGVEPNSSTIVAIMPSIAETCRLREGRAAHGFCLRRDFHDDVVVGTGLLDMYGKCGKLVHAKHLFKTLALKNEITWSAMIGAFVTCDYVEEALELFKKMRMEASMTPSPVMLATVIRGCAKLNDLNVANQIHCYTFKSGYVSDIIVCNTLLSLYAKCGSMNYMIKFFQEMQAKDSVSYSAIITGCVQNGNAEDALQMFHKMQLSGFEPELATMMGFLPACSQLSALQHGICGHGYSVVRGFESNVSLSNALIDMYNKCGKIEEARLVFDKMHGRDVVSWNAMLVGYGIHGYGKEAILLFQNMQNEGAQPDYVTFVALLSACSHSGLVSEGKYLFHVMSQEFKILPRMDHYFCMVDLLGRAGLLDEAHNFVSTMPFEPDAHLWNALLSACRIHKNIELGEAVSKKIQSLGPSSTGNFVLLFNMYTTAHRWDDAAVVRITQKDLGFRKRPGCSWIEVNGIIHAFVGGDRSHPQFAMINKKLDELDVEMKIMGYSAESDFVYQDVEEEEKEKILLYHSEKLAVAFAIISLKAHKPIIVTKNLRVCGDCHTALKYMTIIAKREITVRDTSRFHHFREGICSCGEFW
ncbi:pentatricopeptide repeat-containing protein [Dorcoceras hygrometricum]|uniref:Pentatricopeptide repeat-containing protein n=1 Tax=Dorcoceras hygrometricum TaxID=472368 RepID=A0A2Z7B362_9LAMI|nr:pentatricopeptide repeat-containing protein [Dorcoceras hygrometricum]